MKLTIKNTDNIKGKAITTRWEINDVRESNENYVIELANQGQFKHTLHAAWIDRMKYGDGYRLHSSDYKGNNIETYLKDVSEQSVMEALSKIFQSIYTM